MAEPPSITVVVPAYNSRSRISIALDSLREQDLEDPFEVIVVDSGDDGCADFVSAAYPEARVVRSDRRLYPGGAANLGIRLARGGYVAFLPCDCAADRAWLRRRLARHREGFAAVGGAVTNGTPGHPIGSAGYYLEYTSVMPDGRILNEQDVPHSMSYERELLERLDGFPEDVRAGEDTVLNRRCVLTDTAVVVDPEIRLAHHNLTSLRPYVRHQWEHGLAHVRCAERYAIGSPTHPRDRPTWRLFVAVFVIYPARRMRNALIRIARGRPRWLPSYIALSPLILAGAWSTSIGLWQELARLRREGDRADVTELEALRARTGPRS
jgi:glycosyltransferase involved in cell wall biosynthesis